MILEHIALYTLDLERLKHFYCVYFSAQVNEKYHNPRTGLETYFLTFAGGARLELMQRSDTQQSPRPNSLGYAHIAFKMGNRDRVEALTQQLQAAGYPLKSAPRMTGDGYYESVVTDPDGNLIELVA